MGGYHDGDHGEFAVAVGAVLNAVGGGNGVGYGCNRVGNGVGGGDGVGNGVVKVGAIVVGVPVCDAAAW